jgi:xanthine dehydrogenase/oxidase
MQVASRVLKVNPEKIHITETAVDKAPNTSATAASAGSDINGMAIVVMYNVAFYVMNILYYYFINNFIHLQNACNEIMSRIQHIIDADPNGTWEKWISKAYLNRISLSAAGFYKTPDIGYNMNTNTGSPFNYFTYGAACSEVEVDCLTGDHQVQLLKFSFHFILFIYFIHVLYILYRSRYYELILLWILVKA